LFLVIELIYCIERRPNRRVPPTKHTTKTRHYNNLPTRKTNSKITAYPTTTTHNHPDLKTFTSSDTPVVSSSLVHSTHLPSPTTGGSTIVQTKATLKAVDRIDPLPNQQSENIIFRYLERYEKDTALCGLSEELLIEAKQHFKREDVAKDFSRICGANITVAYSELPPFVYYDKKTNKTAGLLPGLVNFFFVSILIKFCGMLHVYYF